MKLPTYPWFDQVSPGLLTRNQLAEQGWRPGGPVRAQVVWRRGERIAYLYQYDEAKPKQAATPAQLAALEKAQIVRRTCPHCQTVFSRIPRADAPCLICRNLLLAADKAEAAARAAMWIETPGACVLDIESTGLPGYCVDIAVAAMDGTMLLNSLINPLVPIPDAVAAIHGITDTMVQDAPTFAAVEPALALLLSGRLVITYNAECDRQFLYADLQRLTIPPKQWLRRVYWACAMECYAAWFGDYSLYHEDYTWQPLYGNHRALGDVDACLARIYTMAALPIPSLIQQRQCENGYTSRSADAGNPRDPRPSVAS